MKQYAIILICLFICWGGASAVVKLNVKNHTTLQNPQTFTTTFDGRVRTYLIYTPQNSTARKPDGILVTCHGFGGKMEDAYQTYGFKEAADAHNLILISPQALPEEDQSLQATANQIGYDLTAVWGNVLYVDVLYIKQTLNRKIDDVAFIRHLIQEVASTYEANINNTFISGVSMGGYMSYAYAIKHGNELSGLINMVGTMGLNLDTANVSVSLPILDFHSTTDEVVFYTGSGMFNRVIPMTNGIGKQKVLEYWAKRNHIVTPPVITNLGSNKNVSFIEYYYNDPTNEITHYQLTGASHSYAPGPGSGNPIDQAIEMKSFVKRHLKSSNTSIISNYSSMIKVYPSIVENELFVRGVKETQSAYIINVYGQIMQTISLDAVESQSFSITQLPKGLYWLKVGDNAFRFVKK